MTTLIEDLFFKKCIAFNKIAKDAIPGYNYSPYSLFKYMYGEPERHYHGMQHIVELLHVHHMLAPYILEKNRVTVKELALVEATIWYHDIIYNVHQDSKNNETKSALFWLSIQTSMPHTMMNSVYDAINASTHFRSYRPKDLIRWQKYFLDLDLLGLGMPYIKFHDNTCKIAKENVGKDGSVIKFAKARLSFVNMLLSREEPLYYNPYDLTLFKEAEANSKVNLVKEKYEIEQAIRRSKTRSYFNME